MVSGDKISNEQTNMELKQNPSRWSSCLVIVLSLLTIQMMCYADGGITLQTEFVWTKNTINFESNGYQLIGSISATYYNAYLVTQCAYRCLQSSTDQCASYNYYPTQRKCELNSASHLTSADSLRTMVDSQYYLRNSFSIDEAALGPCSKSPCSNQGTCLTVASMDGLLTFQCVCHDGWTGTACNVTANQPVWNIWSDWSRCSSTCGNGVKVRHRQCINSINGQELSSQLCFGPETEQADCNLQDCPGWSNFGIWSQCSTDSACGPGNQVRTRSCNNGGVPGIDRMCMGPTNQTTPCLSPNCDTPVRLVNGSTYGEGRINVYDNAAGIWLPVCSTSWSKNNADVVCRQLGFNSGSFMSQESRFSNEPMAGSAVSNVICNGDEEFLAMCSRSTWHNVSCATGPHVGVQCIVDGRWGSWSDWSDCSVTCANGVSVRRRQCNSPAPQRGGNNCTGSAEEAKPCTAAPCPVDGTWKSWSEWGLCNATCGGGWQIRTRECQQPQFGGTNCVGPSMDSQACNTQNCPIDGTWGDWSQWSSCNATCGSGTRLRVRSCIGPFYGGAACQGDSQESAFCNDNPCPVNGQWSSWSRWLDCSTTCGVGSQTRYRVCDGASNGGNCAGNDRQYQYQNCSLGPCPINCTWQDWSTWSSCNASCGGGVQFRTRITIPAQYGGADCSGDSVISMPCNTNPCYTPGLWSAWSNWSLCSATCGTTGLRTRSRTCNMTTYGALTSPCLSTDGVGATDTKACNQFSCTPIASSCQELFNRGLEDDDSFVNIDIDLASGPLPQFGVECQRSGATITTLVHTANEVATTVQGYDAPGQYVSAVQYVDNNGGTISSTQVISLVDKSLTCRQYIAWRCRSAAINSPTSATGNSYKITWWMNRYNKTMSYWGGATPPSTNDASSTTICACGQTSTCAVPNTKCNCDAEDNVWRIDDGYITRKLDLPILTFSAGDTGVPGSTGKQGQYIVGPLICN